MNDVDWPELHRLVFIDQPECWTTCGGGYCCKTNSPHLRFNFMKPNSAGMVFFEEEYEFLLKQNILQSGFQEQARQWRFTFAPGLDLRFVTSVCSLEGKCSIPQYRPLICKLYPYLPRIDLETLETTGFVNASVVDQLWKTLKIEEPCTLAREKADIVKNQMQPGINVLKKYPYVLFYIKAAELFLDEISDNFRQLRENNPAWTITQLVSLWEVGYLSGRAFQHERFKELLRQQHTQLVRKVGEFKL